MPLNALNGRSVLITGAGSGIGRATALLLAAEGGRVFATDKDADRAAETAREVAEAGASAVALELDVRVEEDWRSAIERVESEAKRLDVLVANAGIALARPVEETSIEEWRNVMAVNLDGVFLGVKHTFRAMRRGGRGSVVIVSSASGARAQAGASAYSASKAAVRLLARCAALEGAPAGIRVNTILPGGVATEMWSSQPFF
jgi:NAD(P)-dependent dehydrogenase (short-subunit alcohol dehydrogenase family)